jgi:hypothetical protein
MAIIFTDAFANKVLDAAFNQTNLTAPTTLTIKLYTAMPSQTAGTGGTEVTGGTYAAQTCTTKFTTAASRAVDSNAEIDFGTAGSSFTIVGWAIFDETPTMIVSGTLSVSATTGAAIKIPSGAFDISVPAS